MSNPMDLDCLLETPFGNLRSKHMTQMFCQPIDHRLAEHLTNVLQL